MTSSHDQYCSAENSFCGIYIIHVVNINFNKVVPNFVAEIDQKEQ